MLELFALFLIFTPVLLMFSILHLIAVSTKYGSKQKIYFKGFSDFVSRFENVILGSIAARGWDGLLKSRHLRHIKQIKRAYQLMYISLVLAIITYLAFTILIFISV